MSNKLQELTDRLYNEGLSKGKEEGELLLSKAQKEAESIISEAKAKAESIIADAQKSAIELKAKAESDIKMASEQSLQATKTEIENLLINASINTKVEESSKDAEFIKSIITEVASKFSASEPEDISIILPESMKEQLQSWASNELGKAIGKEIKAEFSKKLRGGFTIGPKNGSWYVSLSDESFKDLISAYMRPVVRKILFG